MFIPNAHQAVEDVSASQSRLWVKILDDVSGRLIALSRDSSGKWSGTPVALPDKSTVHLNATASNSDIAFATVEGMLTPPTLFRVDASGSAAPIQALPAQFDASGMVVEQQFATSPDGTRIPYFMVHRKDVKGPVPVLMHAYGGFELAQTPSYLVHEPYRSGPLALFWVQQGNAYVLANIRGGGEYGPRWHKSVLRENRQKAYDDLYAVGQDLVARGVTQKGRLAVSGRSNGGLMASVAITQRPGLVRRGDHRLASGRHEALFAPARGRLVDGRIWQSRCARRLGVHQQIFALPEPQARREISGAVHLHLDPRRPRPSRPRPQARRPARSVGDPFYYDEAIEGGHAAGIVPEEDAQRVALEAVYLNSVLPPR